MKAKLIYDISAMPDKLDPANFIKIFDNFNVCFWDSSKGTKPKLYDITASEEISIVDTAGKEIPFDYYSKQFADKEFWDKELYYCKNSLIYYYSNYLTPTFPHTREGLSEYLKSMNLTDIERSTTEEAKKAWEEQKAVAKKAMESLTVEELQEHKSRIDLLKTQYSDKINKFESALRDVVTLTDKDNAPLKDSVRVKRLIDKIKKESVVPSKYVDTYRSRKGRWDVRILGATNYSTLLEILYDLHEGKDKE